MKNFSVKRRLENVTRIRSVLVFLFIVSGLNAAAQSGPYALSIKVYTSSCRIVGFNYNNLSGLQNYSSVPAEFNFVNDTQYQYEIIFTGSNWIGQSGPMLLNLYATCDLDGELFSVDISNLSVCNPLGFDSPENGHSGIITLIPKMQLQLSNVSCNGIGVTSSCALENSILEISQNLSSWQQLTQTDSYGYTPQTVSITAQDLSSRGFNPYATTHVRAKDSRLNEAFQYSRTSDVQSFSLFAPPPTVSVTGSTNTICNGSSDGTVTLNISNAVSAVNQFYVNVDHADGTLMLLSSVSAGAVPITGLKAGNWSIQVVNNTAGYGACSTTISHTVNEPTQVTVSFTTPLHNGYAISCNGGNNGQTTVVGAGGVGGYKDFVWNTGATTPTITGLTAGTYSVSLKDQNDCVATGNVTLNQPSALQASTSPATNYNGYGVSCWNRSDGALQVAPAGGVPGYTYSWSNGATSQTATGLSPSIQYSVIVTDANSCTTSSNNQLTVPAPIDFQIQQLSSIDCPGDRTSLEASNITNTIGSIGYAWSTGETLATITDKSFGNYSLTISDAQGCSTQKSLTIADPPSYTVSITAGSNYNGSIIRCNGEANGALTALVRDNTNAIVSAENYLWTRNGVTVGDSPSLATLPDLDEGFYAVEIIYNGQCKANASYSLFDPSPISVLVETTTDYNGQPIRCAGLSDATIRATVTGGTGTYTYQWNATTGTTAQIVGVGAGTYDVVVKDVNLCEGMSSIVLTDPLPVELQIVATSNFSGYGVSCAGASDGMINTQANGGTGVYTYQWTSGHTTSQITGVVAGNYTVTATDENGCNDAMVYEITTPEALTLSVVDKRNVSCFNGNDGSVTLLAAGGTNQFEYSQNNTTWQSEPSFISLFQGAYQLYVRDQNGCSETVAETITQPTQISITFTGVDPAFCSDPVGRATGVVSGGVGNYDYTWRVNGQTEIINTSNSITNVPAGIYRLFVNDGNNCPADNAVAITSTDGAQTTYIAESAKCFDSSDGHALITITDGDGPFVINWPDGQSTLQGNNLRRGTYNVLITDTNNCSVVQSVNIDAPDSLQLNVSEQVMPTCNAYCDGQLTLQATGGVGNYTYEWNGTTGAQQSQLCAAIYPVTVEDGNGCRITRNVTLTQPAPMLVTLVRQTPPTCNEGCDGVLEVIASGGNGNYGYVWENGGTTNIQDNLCPGNYNVLAADQKGCTADGNFQVNDTPPLQVNLGGGVTLCVGQTYTLNAGQGWASVSWSGANNLVSTEQRIVVKDPGLYYLEVLSSEGCVGRDTFLLETSFDLLKANFAIADRASVGDTVVIIDVSWPLPESIQWYFPEEMAKVMDAGEVVYGQFNAEGTYPVRMTATLGECYDEMVKTITIIDREEDLDGGRLGYERFVKEFMLHPNPNDGKFDVTVELLEESQVIISVWSTVTSKMIGKISDNGHRSYVKSFDIRPLSPGIYVLRLDHARGKEYIRFVVH